MNLQVIKLNTQKSNFFEPDELLNNIRDWTIYKNIEATCIASDLNGCIWIGTSHHGVFRFDGQNWTQITVGPNSLLSNNITAIAVDKLGHIWVGTLFGSISVFDGEKWESDILGRNVKKLFNPVRKILVDNQNIKWIATEGFGVFAFDNIRNPPTTVLNACIMDERVYDASISKNGILYFASRQELFTYDPKSEVLKRIDMSSLDIEFHDIRKIFIDSKAQLWANSYDYLHKFVGNEWFTNLPDGLLDHYSITEDEEGYLWLASSRNGLVRFDGSHCTFFNTQNCKIPNNRVLCMTIDAKGQKWLCTQGNSLSLFDGNTWSNYEMGKETCLADNFILSAIRDKQGALWFGTFAGVSKFDGQKWTNYNTANSGLLSNSVHDMALNKEGVIWFATSSGLSSFDGTTWTTYEDENGHMITDLGSIAIDNNERVWMGSSGGNGATCIYGQKCKTFNPQYSSLVQGQVRSILADSKGNIWFGTEGGISCYTADNNWRNFTQENSVLPGNSVNALAEDKNGVIWFGTSSGIALFEGDNLVEFAHYDNKVPTLSSINVIAVDEDNNKWIGTSTGLFILNSDNTLVRINQSNSRISDDYISSIILPSDDTKEIWIGTFRGLNRLFL